MFNLLFIEVIGVLAALLINNVKSVHGIDNVLKTPRERYIIDLNECTWFEKQCSHLNDDLALLSCALNASHNNKTQVSFICQHKIWIRQAELIDNSFLEYKLKGPCQDETIMDCLSPSTNSIDCVLKRKPSIKDKNCLRLINKIETLIFNDWQITNNFLKNCLDDIEAHTCGRIPPDPKSLSQMQTLKCLQGFEQNLRPECQSELLVLQEMKYTTLQLDKLVFAACSLDQKKFCPEELPGSLLLYKCLARHKYERGILSNIHNFV